jgi:GNAT superfamily N-acetyltransferase
LATRLLPESAHPGDARQIRHEGVVEPTHAEIAARLRECSPADDVWQWQQAVDWAATLRCKPAPRQATRVSMEVLGAEELGLVHELAHAIWPAVYPGIISAAQISYMLERMYALPVLHEDAARGVCYAVLRDEGRAIGYVGCEARVEAGEMCLHKLYLLPEYAGGGLGSQMLRWVGARAGGLGLASVVLRVNRANAGAIRAYRRAGYEFRQDVVADIGNGFVMDDHEMITSAIAVATPPACR